MRLDCLSPLTRELKISRIRLLGRGDRRRSPTGVAARVTVRRWLPNAFQTMNPIQSVNPRSRLLAPLGRFIFLSRWLQAPLYVGLIVAQGVYVYHFLKELWHLVEKAPTIDETTIMLTVLGLRLCGNCCCI